jgi:amino acid transporter
MRLTQPIAPFGIFGQVFQVSGGMVAGAYMLGMLGMLLTAHSYAEMVAAFPLAGSVYTYAGRAIGPSVGFLARWVILLDYVLVPGLLALIAAAALTAFAPTVPLWSWIAVFVVVNTIINLVGLRLTAVVTRWFLIGELLVLLVFLTVGVCALRRGSGRGWSWDPVFNPATFSWPVLLSAASLAVLSFLGFDAVSTLAEENRGGARQIGRAMTLALGMTGVLFAAQTWVCTLLVSDPARLVREGDSAGTAFYDVARTAGGPWLATLTALATALSWGIANSLVAQVATSRLLFAMARDRQLLGFLGRVSSRRAVPTGAVWTSAAISLGLGIWMALRPDGIAVMGSLVTFGALCAFVILHGCVICHYLIRRRSRAYVRHLLLPLAGASLLVAVAINANIAAQRLGLVWLGIGVVVLLGMVLTGRRPRLAGLAGLAGLAAEHLPPEPPGYPTALPGAAGPAYRYGDHHLGGGGR